ncbi:MAG: A/G-specific adenine glycosylase [Marinirhabdus sp.]|nr:A/G-specific adenine glycosylase [Marinirhabdus sp.]
MVKNNTQFTKKLISWYLENKRDLPWRKTNEPYRIWLSEIILQQTRVAQGLPYYESFVSAYPTVEDLAAASEEEVLKLWQGLGYYSRARNLRIAATFVANELNGVFPESYDGLLQLKGVGDYTASAIASICYGEPAAVVDGNVYRVLSRYFGIDTAINSTKGIKDFKKLAQSVLDPDQPGTYNQAIMEFGARSCVPKSPDCPSCIFADSCAAFQSGRVGELPKKLKKTKVKKRFFNYLVYLAEDNTTKLQQRKGSGIWQGLYEFPKIEAAKQLSKAELVSEFAANYGAALLDSSEIIRYNDTPVVHKLSHQHLVTTFWIVRSASIDADRIPVSQVERYPVPILIGNFIRDFDGFQSAS